MKNYSHVISKLFNEPTLITPARHAALCHLLENRLARLEMPGRDKADEGGDEDEDEHPMLSRVGDTAIIRVHGTLVAHPEDLAMSECGCSMEDLGRAIEEAEQSHRIERIVYDFRTPGGAVTGVPETARKILHSRKETIGWFDSECASGGAWLAAQCQRLFGSPSGQFGSIGVYTLALDMSRALENEGIKINAISAGKYKLLGAHWKPLTDEERGHLQARVDKIYSQFKAAMESHRVVSDHMFGNGLVFDGEEAAEMGFTDGVFESFEDMMEALEED